MADALAELDADALNRKAWRLYRQCVNRLTIEGGAVGTALEKLTADSDHEEFSELLDRFIVAFDTFNPLPEPKD